MKKTIIIFYGKFTQNMSYDWIPSGPIFVSALLKANGFNPVIIHEFKDQNYENIIKEHLDELLLFGISAMTGYQIESGIRAVKILKNNRSDIPVIWGGAHATADPLSVLKSDYADYVYVGPVKNNLIYFLSLLKNSSKEMHSVTDILFKNNVLKNIDDFRYKIQDYKIDWSGFPSFNFNDYDFSYLLTKNRVLNYTTSMGCPGNCSFCSWGGKHPWTSLSMDRILDDLEYIVSRYQLKSIWFSDSELSIKKKHLLGIAQGLIDRRIKVYWRGNARVKELSRYSKNDFKLLEQSGMDRIFIGVENINSEIQKAFKKEVQKETVFLILENMNNLQIKIMIAFIFGNVVGPSSDLEENREFINQCLRINPNVRYQVSFYTPYPGTNLIFEAEKLGYKRPKTLEEYAKDPLFLDTSRSAKRIPWYSEIKSEEYLAKYSNLFQTVNSEPEWNWRDFSQTKL